VADIGDENAGCAPATSFVGVQTMCEKCKEIDAHIARYERLRAQTSDKIFLAGVDELLKNYRIEKAALHPEEK
jgi:hypothetical protein